MKKGKWSKQEDYLLKNHIDKYGINRGWQALSNTIGLRRCGRSCRSRWLNYLRPGLKHGNFTSTEDRIICEMYRIMGSCWSIIAAQLPGRTDLAVKNYWNSTLRKRFPVAKNAALRGSSAKKGPTISTSSDTTTPSLPLLAYYECTESGSSHGAEAAATTVLAGSPPEISVAATPVSAGPVEVHQKPPNAMEKTLPDHDQVGELEHNCTHMSALPLENMDMDLCSPMSPLPHGVMDMDLCSPMSPLPHGIMDTDLPYIGDLDDIDSILSWFGD